MCCCKKCSVLFLSPVFQSRLLAGCEEVTAVSISRDEDDNASTCSDGDLFDFGEDEIDDFEEAGRKVGLDMRFPKRPSYMAHTLQLALAGGMKASGCRAQGDALTRVVRRSRKTQLAAERPHGRSGLNLPCITRWKSLCYAMERHVRVKDAVCGDMYVLLQKVFSVISEPCVSISPSCFAAHPPTVAVCAGAMFCKCPVSFPSSGF
ncbi:hypothetical protein Tcan_03022 [Toxocara canis]|uniref:Uncharacterized protein n=1 Tax=Toxocara canis TaxID=6265 RepID=A0A0B2UX08_TOXCA|nr:hypothetical protein Tcan_03022 [Toxocara canis]